MTDFNVDILVDGVVNRREVRAFKPTMEILKTGLGVLDKAQDTPPMQFLPLLEERAKDLARLGPESTSPKLMQKISDRIVIAGQRQLMAEGHVLHWAQGKIDLLSMVETTLSACTREPANLFAQLRNVCRHKISSSHNVMRFSCELTKEEQRSRGLICEGTYEPLLIVTETPNYVMVGLDWRQFFDRLGAIEEMLHGTIDLAFAEGRILCSETESRGDRFMPSELVGAFKNQRRKQQRAYLLSQDLPDEWFSGSASLPRRRAQATEWINKAGSYFAEDGRRARSDDLKLVAMEKFDLTENAVQSIWKKCNFGNKGKKGAISRAETVFIDEIRQIE